MDSMLQAWLLGVGFIGILWLAVWGIAKIVSGINDKILPDEE